MAISTREPRKIGRPRTETYDYFKFQLKLPDEMMERIAALAKADFTTMNSTILRMLRDVLPEYEQAARDAGILPPVQGRR